MGVLCRVRAGFRLDSIGRPAVVAAGPLTSHKLWMATHRALEGGAGHCDVKRSAIVLPVALFWPSCKERTVAASPLIGCDGMPHMDSAGADCPGPMLCKAQCLCYLIHQG